MATQIDLGAVVPIGKGDWNEGTTYERANIVRHNSVAWICKVDSSIGVEPTENSSDWYLLVKDTSSVTSVNGQRGDVNLDLITSEEVNSRLPTIMTGATNEVNGVSGLVPPPLKADLGKSLGANGEWTYPADVAIGGDLGDLASARGQVGNSKAVGSHDFSSGMLREKPGMYTAMNSDSTNVPFTGPFAEMILGTPTYKGSLLITSGRSSSPRAAISAADISGFSGYNRLITEQQVGDGITVNNGIISVPEYKGATASTAGTSGLVPPAAAGQADYVLCGDGEWKNMLEQAADAVTPSKKYIDIAMPTWGQSVSYKAPKTGWVSIQWRGPQDSLVAIACMGILVKSISFFGGEGVVSLYVKKGADYNIFTSGSPATAVISSRFIYASGSAPA